jgi:hypothetical protein
LKATYDLAFRLRIVSLVLVQAPEGNSAFADPYNFRKAGSLHFFIQLFGISPGGSEGSRS